MNIKYIFILLAIVISLIALYRSWKYFNIKSSNTVILSRTNVLKATGTNTSGLDKLRCGIDVSIWNKDYPTPLKCECGSLNFNNGITHPIRNYPDRNFCIGNPTIPLNYPYSGNIIFPGRVVTGGQILTSDDGKITFSIQNNFPTVWKGNYDSRGFWAGVTNVPIYYFPEGDRMIMTLEGDLQVYNGNTRTWALSEQTLNSLNRDSPKITIEQKSYAKIDNDGRVKVYNPDNTLLWASPRSILVPGAKLNMGEYLIAGPGGPPGSENKYYVLLLENFNNNARLIFLKYNKDLFGWGGWEADIGGPIFYESVNFNNGPYVSIDSKLCLYESPSNVKRCINYGSIGSGLFISIGEIGALSTYGLGKLYVYTSDDKVLSQLR